MACASCGGANICASNACGAPTCGDGCVTAAAGEQCEPPNTATCDSTCHTIAAAACGNGVLDAGEQCDDGNMFNLDGCDPTCKYEVVTRMTAVAIGNTAAPAALGCMPATNALGTSALTNTALGQLNPTLATAVNNGTVNLMMPLEGLDDLKGINDSSLSIGVADGSLDPAKGAWPGNNPIDWWFLADPSTIGPNGLPKGAFNNATLVNRNLTAGPSNVSLDLNLAGSPALMQMLNAHVAATIDGNPPPNVPAPPPAMLAAGLTVFQTITGNGMGQGLCGNVTVASLAQIPVPAALAGGGNTACLSCGTTSHTYTACTAGQTPGNSNCNSLLDVLVGGCEVLFCSPLSTAVNPTQPDAPSGAAVTPLALGANNKVPNATTMNDMDGYSAYFTFAANRAHFTGETCATTADCQAGKTCTNTTCQ
jgi:cysteine-rich repeat protein